MEGFPGPWRTPELLSTKASPWMSRRGSINCWFRRSCQLLFSSCSTGKTRASERKRTILAGLLWQSLLNCRLMITPIEWENRRRVFVSFSCNCSETREKTKTQKEKQKKENVADRLHTHPPAPRSIQCEFNSILLRDRDARWRERVFPPMNVRERKGRGKVLLFVLSVIKNDNAEQKNKKGPMKIWHRESWTRTRRDCGEIPLFSSSFSFLLSLFLSLSRLLGRYINRSSACYSRLVSVSPSRERTSTTSN